MQKIRINQLYDKNRIQLMNMCKEAIKACKNKIKSEENIDVKKLKFETTNPVPVWNVSKRYFGIEVLVDGTEIDKDFQPRRYFVRVYVQSPTIQNIRGTSEPELVPYNI